MSAEKLARENVVALGLYTPAESSSETIRLNANELPDAVPTAAKNAGLNRYPEVRPYSIRARMASLYSVPAENVLVTRGSSEAIDVLVRTFCRAGQDSVLTTPPAFELYEYYARLQDAAVVNVPLRANNEFVLDSNALIDACRDDTRVIFLCSPNNPSGSLVCRDDVLSIASARRGKSMVVVDEAYIEFSDTKSLAADVADYDNLVVLRTLSKAYGMAGVRCGAAIAHPGIVDIITRVTPPYSFSSPVIDIVVRSLAEDRLAASRQLIANLMGERERVFESLRSLNNVSDIWRSHGNFILLKFSNLSAVMDAMLSHNILIRAFGAHTVLADCARITIGNKTENDLMLAALDTCQDALP